MAKIIVADDEMLIRRLVCDFLIKEGHTPLEAADGKMAVELFNQNPDTALIIMDIMTPELDGWEATKLVKADPETARIPVIALTAHAMVTDKEKALAAGCDEFDTKPVELPRLLEKINALLRAAG